MDIKVIRKQLGMTQEQFAHELGVSFTTVSHWESGRFKPSPMAVRNIERLLEEKREKGA